MTITLQQLVMVNRDEKGLYRSHRSIVLTKYKCIVFSSQSDDCKHFRSEIGDNRKGIASDFGIGRYNHRLLLLKLDKQNSGTIYRPIFAANKA